MPLCMRDESEVYLDDGASAPQFGGPVPLHRF